MSLGFGNSTFPWYGSESHRIPNRTIFNFNLAILSKRYEVYLAHSTSGIASSIYKLPSTSA